MTTITIKPLKVKPGEMAAFDIEMPALKRDAHIRREIGTTWYLDVFDSRRKKPRQMFDTVQINSLQIGDQTYPDYPDWNELISFLTAL